MAAIVNGIFEISTVINGAFRKFGEKSIGFTLSLVSDVLIDSEVPITGAAGGQLIASLGSAPLLIVVIPRTAAGTLSWRGTSDDANSSILCRVDWPTLLSTGQTTAAAATPELRAEAAAQNITQLWYDGAADSRLRLWVAA